MLFSLGDIHVSFFAQALRNVILVPLLITLNIIPFHIVISISFISGISILVIVLVALAISGIILILGLVLIHR